MKKVVIVFVFFSFIILSQCRPLKDKKNEPPPFEIIAKEVIDRQIYQSDYNKFKDSIVIVIDLLSNRDFTNNSKYLIQISADNKKALRQYKNDSIFEFNGMDLYLISDTKKFKKPFTQIFKYLSKDVDNIIKFNEADYSKRWESLFVLDFYINDKNEITYISTGYDTIYYNLLKDKVSFDSKYWEK